MSDMTKLLRDLSIEKLQQLVRQSKNYKKSANEGIIKKYDRNMENKYPLSYAQQRLWIINQYNPSSAAYNIATVVTIEGVFSIQALEYSLNEILQRHESLRTSFINSDGKVYQTIATKCKIEMPIIDIRNLSSNEVDSEWRKIMAQEISQPFDLQVPPLLRVMLVQFEENKYKLLFTMHHIISDGWSLGVLIKEMNRYYEAFVSGKHHEMSELAIQYLDFSLWQKNYLQGSVYEEQLSYWKKNLQGKLPVLQLPTNRPRPLVQSFRGERLYFEIPRDLVNKIKKLISTEEITLFMALLSAYATLLYRYSLQKDILIGTSIANRNKKEWEALIGFFVNTLVIRCDLSKQPTFKELFSRVRETCLGAFANQDFPFEKIVEELHVEREASYQPVVQTYFSLQNVQEINLKMKNLTMEMKELDTKTSKFDISLTLRESNDLLIGEFEYSTD
ncbi:condensation domain-containing protein, partial [Bacillus wiedmannii]|uniref:condensation domain-containing protein n=1 Tax=Bacillus wiedmannii TaxID=1890302 RepID=UPI000BFAC8D8